MAGSGEHWIELDPLSVEQTDIEDIEKSITLAINKTLSLVGNWLKTQSKRRVGKELNIKQSALNSRFVLKKKRDKETSTIRLWIGVLPLSAIEAGNASQNKAGVRVRGRFYRGAFIQSIRGETAIWRRKSSKYEPGEGTGRYPVRKQRIELADKALVAIKHLENQLNAEFNRRFKPQLNYYLNIKK